MSAQGSIIRYITAMVIVGLAVLGATTFYKGWKEIGQIVPADARASAYFEQYSEPDCRFEGTWARLGARRMDDARLPQSQRPTSRGQLQLCDRTSGDFASLDARHLQDRRRGLYPDHRPGQRREKPRLHRTD